MSAGPAHDPHGPVLVLAGTGLMVRNLLLGEMEPALRAEGLDVVAAVRTPGDPALRRALDGAVELLPFIPADPPSLSRLEKLVAWRTYAYYLQLGAKATKGTENLEKVYGSRHSIAGRLAITALKRLGRITRPTGLLRRVERGYEREVEGWESTRRWRETMTEIRPRVVLSSLLTLSKKLYPSEDLPAVVAARQLGLPVGTLVQSWDNITTKTAVLPPWLDAYWTWSERMNDELRSAYPHLPRRLMRVVGSPQFDFHRRPGLVEPRADYARRLGLETSRRWIVFGTGTEVSLPDEPLVALDLAQALASRDDLQLLVRLHPKDHGERWVTLAPELERLGARLQSTAPETHMDFGGFLPPEEFYRDQVSCLRHAAVVLNSSSTLTVDAALLDRPIVCIAYDAVQDPLFPEGRAMAFRLGSHYAPLAATGGVAVASSQVEALAAIDRYLDDPRWDAPGRRQIVELVTATPDGGAGRRLAGELAALAARFR